MCTEFKVARSDYGGEIFYSKQSLFYMSRLYSYKELEDFYAITDNFRRTQNYLGHNIKRSDMKCRHKRAVGIIVKRKKICFSIIMGKSI